MSASHVLEVSDSEFAKVVLESLEPVLVDFWATWCAPCRAIAPLVEQLSETYGGQVKFRKFDIDANPKVPTQYEIRSIPTLLLFKGGQVKEQIVGYVAKEQIQKALDKNVG